jgi:hypothetical protein
MEEGYAAGYVAAAEDTDLVDAALAATDPWLVVQAEINRQERTRQEIQTPHLDRLRAAGLDVPGPVLPGDEVRADLEPCGVIEAELAELVGAGDRIGTLRESDMNHAPHYLGCHEGLRDLLAMSLAQARGNTLAWIAVLVSGDLSAVVQVAIVVVAGVIEDEAEEYGVRP